MLILTATNITPGGLAHKDGTADYDVWVGLNHHCIYKGKVTGHVRDAGAGALLRIIAGQMDNTKYVPQQIPLTDLTKKQLRERVAKLCPLPGDALRLLKRRANAVAGEQQTHGPNHRQRGIR